MATSLVSIQYSKMLQRLWFQSVVVFCILVSGINFGLDLNRRQLRKPCLCIKIYVYVPLIVIVILVPGIIRETVGKSHSYLTNPVAIAANNTSEVLRLGLLLMVVLTMHRRNRNLAKWLEKIFGIQINYFDCLSEGVTRGGGGGAGYPKDISHRKWLYLSSALTIIHYCIETVKLNLNSSKRLEYAVYPLFILLSTQHTYMLIHSSLLGYLRECFSILNFRLAEKRIDPQMTRVYNQLRGLFEELNRIHGFSMLWVILCLLLSNSMVGYIVFVMLLIPDMDTNGYRFLFGSIFYGFLLIHWYIYFMLCQEVQTTIQDIDVILYECTTTEDNANDREVWNE